MTPRPHDIDVLACDYDRTLTNLDLELEQSTLDALREAREAGLKVLAVSGRDTAFLREHVGDAVDLIVSENGAFLADPATGHEEPLFTDWPTVEELRALGVPLDYASASASAHHHYEEALARAVKEAGITARLERNVDRIMLLPAGVEKAAGFEAALKRLGIPPERAAAIGDGENDLSLLGAAGYRIAVSNAVPDVKAIAHHVTTQSGGAGVREWLRESWLPPTRRPRGAASRRG